MKQVCALAGLLLAAGVGAQNAPVKVDVDALVSAYRTNPLAATKTYAGKTLDVAGKVSNIEEAPSGAYVYFGGAWEGYIVQLATTEEDAIELVPGQAVTFRCRTVKGGQRFNKDVILGGCTKVVR